MSSDRYYQVVYSDLYSDEKVLYQLTDAGKLMWPYILIGRHRKVFPAAFSATRDGLISAGNFTPARGRKGIRELELAGMIEADWRRGVVYLPNAFKWFFESKSHRLLSSKTLKAWVKAVGNLAACELKEKVILITIDISLKHAPPKSTDQNEAREFYKALESLGNMRKPLEVTPRVSTRSSRSLLDLDHDRKGYSDRGLDQVAAAKIQASVPQTAPPIPNQLPANFKTSSSTCSYPLLDKKGTALAVAKLQVEEEKKKEIGKIHTRVLADETQEPRVLGEVNLKNVWHPDTPAKAFSCYCALRKSILKIDPDPYVPTGFADWYAEKVARFGAGAFISAFRSYLRDKAFSRHGNRLEVFMTPDVGDSRLVVGAAAARNIEAAEQPRRKCHIKGCSGDGLYESGEELFCRAHAPEDWQAFFRGEKPDQKCSVEDCADTGVVFAGTPYCYQHMPSDDPLMLLRKKSMG